MREHGHVEMDLFVVDSVVDVGQQDDQVRRPADGEVDEYHQHDARLLHRLQHRLVGRLVREALQLALRRVHIQEDADVADGNGDERYDDAGREEEDGVVVDTLLTQAVV